MKKKFRVTIEGRVYEIEVEIEDPRSKIEGLLNFISRARVVRRRTLPQQAAGAMEKNVVKAPLGGRILKIRVKPGDKVEKGDVVVILESMKTQVEIRSSSKGVVKEVLVGEGDAVKPGDRLILLG